MSRHRRSEPRLGHQFLENRLLLTAVAAGAVVLGVHRQLRDRQRIAAELQRSRLGREHARRHVALLAQGSRALVAGLDDEAAALQSLVGAVVPEFADWCAVDLVEEGEVRRVASAHTRADVGARVAELLAERPGWASPVRRVMASGRAELGWDTQPEPVPADDADHLAAMAALGLVSWLTVPVRIQGLSVGAISCGTAAGRRGFRPSDVSAMEELASRTAVAIERIALYRETQRAAAEAAQRAGQLRRLMEAALAVQPQHSARGVATVVAEQARRVLGAGCALVVAGAGDGGVRVAAGPWGEKHDRRLTGAGEAETGAASRVVDPATGAVQALAARLSDRDGRPAGTLAVADKGDGAFTDDDESLLVSLAQMASVAIDNARLYETVRAGEAHLLAVVEVAPLAILEFGPDGRLRRGNTAAQGLLGRGDDEATSISFHPETAGVLRRFVADTVAGAPLTDVELTVRRADGAEVPVSLAGAALRDAAGVVDGVLVLVADVTARRHLEEQLVRARRIEAVGQVAGGVAHDFNNLLTVVLGHAALLAASLAGDDPRRADVEAISLAAERAAGITAQLLTISRGDLVSTEMFDPRDRLGRLAETLRSVLPESIDLVLEVEAGDGLVRMSPAQFDQVVLNLVINGRDAMVDEGTLTLRLADAGDVMVVEVADTGSGMDAATAERCFEPFFTTKGGLRGTGLGLATVHSVVTGAGGEVGLDSEPGTGTTFRVRLPRVVGEAPTPAPDRPSAAAGSERILLVENEDGLRRLAVEVLRSAGYVVTPAADGRAALEAVAADMPDLVVTDVVMPRMGGVELAGSLAEDHPGLPVLFMTGYVDHASREGLEGAEVLLKPFVVDELVARVREVLDRAGRSPQGSKR